MEGRIVKAQAIRNSQMDQFMGARKIMELNTGHLIMRTLKEKVVDETNHKQCKDIVELLYSNAILNSGFILENPSEYANKVNKMIEVGFCDEEEDQTLEDPPDLQIHRIQKMGLKGFPLDESKMEEVD